MQYHNPIPIQTMALAMRQEKENYTIGVSGYTDAGGQDNGIVGMETLHCKNVVDRVSEGSIVVVNKEAPDDAATQGSICGWAPSSYFISLIVMLLGMEGDNIDAAHDTLLAGDQGDDAASIVNAQLSFGKAVEPDEAHSGVDVFDVETGISKVGWQFDNVSETSYPQLVEGL